MARAHVDPTTGLTEKQEKFCLAYLETGNASEAYRRAYDAADMAPETVHKRASELLDNGAIAGRVAALRAAAAEKAVATVAEALEVATKMLRADIRKLFRDDGSLKPPGEWPDDLISVIASVKTTERNGDKGVTVIVREIKLADRHPSVDRFFKHFGLFERDNNQSAPRIIVMSPKDPLPHPEATGAPDAGPAGPKDGTR